jgi:hypothetical protein
MDHATAFLFSIAAFLAAVAAVLRRSLTMADILKKKADV